MLLSHESAAGVEVEGINSNWLLVRRMMEDVICSERGDGRGVVKI